ncbi:MAG: hypothetical protein JXA28_13585 [Bacteroidetes bacterium]|nr:hypothetical protein [Bacteroidota bacterium]
MSHRLLPLCILSIALPLLLGSISCSDDTPPTFPLPPVDTTDTPNDSLPHYAEADTLCRIHDERVTELSGIAPSRWSSALLWMHNDSGDGPRLFVVDTLGDMVAICTLNGSVARDWEDISTVMLDGTSWIYIGDIGDNTASRLTVSVSRFPEPRIDPAWRDSSVSVTPEQATFTFADGPRDCEALMVDPRTGVILIIEKSGIQTTVYRAAWPGDGDSAVLQPIVDLALPFAVRFLNLVTGADISPSGDRVVVRCYGGIVAYTGVSVEKALSADKSTVLPAAPLAQAEAVCYTDDGTAVLTTTEGKQPPVLRFHMR